MYWKVSTVRPTQERPEMSRAVAPVWRERLVTPSLARQLNTVGVSRPSISLSNYEEIIELYSNTTLNTPTLVVPTVTNSLIFLEQRIRGK